MSPPRVRSVVYRRPRAFPYHVMAGLGVREGRKQGRVVGIGNGYVHDRMKGVWVCAYARACGQAVVGRPASGTEPYCVKWGGYRWGVWAVGARPPAPP